MNTQTDTTQTAICDKVSKWPPHTRNHDHDRVPVLLCAFLMQALVRSEMPCVACVRAVPGRQLLSRWNIMSRGECSVLVLSEGVRTHASRAWMVA